MMQSTQTNQQTDFIPGGVLHHVPGLAGYRGLHCGNRSGTFPVRSECPKMRMVFLTTGGTNSFMVELIQLLGNGAHGTSATSARSRDVILAFRVDDLAAATRAMSANGQQPVSQVIDIQLNSSRGRELSFTATRTTISPT